MIKIGALYDPVDILSMPYMGEVVSNLDPKKLGRLKVVVKGLFEGTESDLPWCFPQNSSLMGGKSSGGMFAVPEIGSKVIIEFPFDDIYSPCYTGHWETSTTHSTAMDSDYPNTYGFSDSTGNKFNINKTKKTAEFTHSSGSKIKISLNGDVEITSVGNILLNGGTGRVLTTESDPFVDNITGAPSIGSLRVKAGMA
jgi:hypothetical protein